MFALTPNISEVRTVYVCSARTGLCGGQWVQPRAGVKSTRASKEYYPINSCITCPCTSVNRRSIPLFRKVNLVWSIPNK